MKSLLFFIHLFLSFSVLGQNLKTTDREIKNEFFAIRKIQNPQNAVQWGFPQGVSSFVIRIPKNQDFAGAYVKIGDEKIPLIEDHDSGNDFSKVSQLFFVSPNNPDRNISLLADNWNNPIEIHEFSAPPLAQNAIIDQHLEKNTARTEDCDFPNTIKQSTWRTGLKPPAELPYSTQVRHVIVHHAAGSNSATDYTSVIRNIYLLHTESNGWNDVGYNFLIAQDGTIFEGRDGQNVTTTDNVTGAHFCGKNQNTMGICLFGNYEIAGIKPTEATLQSLGKLIAWKLKKENLNPLGENTHSGGALKTISGHRDGCSTDCPGTNTYALLSQIRAEVSRYCAVLANESLEENTPIILYPNPTRNTFSLKNNILQIQNLELYDACGRKMKVWEKTQVIYSVSELPKGIYWLRIQTEKGKKIEKLLLE